MALSKAAIRAIAIRRSIARKQTESAAPTQKRTRRSVGTGVLAACIAAAGYEQHAAY